MNIHENNNAALVRLLESWRYVEDFRRGRPQTSLSSYLAAALEQEGRAILAHPVGSGLNEQLTKSAFSIGTLIQPQGLDYADAFNRLYGYAQKAGANDPPKDRSVIERQLREGMKHPRDLGPAQAGTLPHRNGRSGGQTLRIPAEASEPLPPEPALRVEPFPLEVLPPALARFTREGAAALCCPPDYLAVPLLCAAAAAIGASRALRLTSDWWVFPALFAAVVAPPSSAKSPAAARALSPVRYQQLINKARFRAQRREWDEAEVKIGERPAFVRTYVTDTTVEKLASLLAECPRGLLYHRDELVSWIASFNQYRDGGKGADQQAFMSIWDHQSISIERKAHDDGLPITVQRPCLTVFGTVQPDVLHQLTHSQPGQGRPADGFIERILFSYADPVAERRWFWEGISTEARRAWRDLLGRLYSLQMQSPLEEGDDPWPQFLSFTDEARPAWESWYNGHQALRTQLPEALHACHAKLESYCGRLALLIELLWYAAGPDGFNPTTSPDVGRGAVECAAALTGYFLSHARRAFGCLELTPQDRRIERAVTWIRQRGGTATLRDLLHNRVAGVKRSTEACRLIEDLVDRCLGTATVEKAPGNGREVTRFCLHSADSAD